MYYSEDTLQKHIIQIRRIARSREKGAERRIHKIYNDLIKDLQGFLGEQYTKYADDGDVLSFALLQRKGSYARFIEEAEKKINKAVSAAAKEIRETVEKVYTICYNGIVDGVKKAVTNEDLHNNLKGIKGCTPEAAKRAVQNPVNGLTLNKTLEKNRKEIIYNINKEITTGLNQGDRYSTAAKRLTDKVNISYNKAMRIVRTETHKVCEGGIHDASNNVDEILRKNPEYGLRMVKTWRNMGDSKVRPSGKSKGKSRNGGKAKKTGGILKNLKSKGKKGFKGLFTGGAPNHIIMDKQTVLQNEMFDLGGRVMAIAPGHSGVAGHDCNCRCFIVVSLMTEDEFIKAAGRGFNDSKENFEENGVDKFAKSDIIKVRPTKVIEGHSPPPIKSEPNDVIDHKGNNGKTKTRSFYDSKGNKKKDINTDNHANPKNHPYGKNGEHAHDYTWENNKIVGRNTRELTDTERKENGDIL